MSIHVTAETPSPPESGRSQAGREVQDSAPRLRWKLGLLGVGGVAVLVSVAALMRGAMVSPETDLRSTHVVTRGDLVVTVTEQGTLESARNKEIKCKVRGGYGGRGGESTVTWVISPGSIVEAGDELIRLDTKIIEETISLGKTDTNNAKAELARAEADLANAQVAVDAYLDGRYRSQIQALEKRLKIASRNLDASRTMVDNAEMLFQKGFVSELEIKAIKYTLTQAELEVKVVETEIDVLSRLTKAMELETLNGQLTATTARLAGRKAGLELEQSRLDLALQEFEYCVITAPSSGLVIYPSTAKWKDAPDVTEGARVHNNQVLLLMPDLSQMQIKVEIHESIIDRIKPGLIARVTLPSRTLETEVSSVAEVARAAGWWTGNVVKYDTIIELPSEAGLKPGMSAEVELIVAVHEDVLSVPVSAVLETDQGHVCWVETAAGPQQRSLELGDTNDEFIVVESGLTENERVVLNPLATIPAARELVGSALVYTVKRGELLVTLTEQGALESSDNTQIKCKVRGHSTINWVIENGTQVESGDELVRLDNKEIEDFLHERTKYAHLSRDAAIGFRAHATRAGLAISEYLEGRYLTELMTLEKDLAIAEARLTTGKNILGHAQMMAERGYISELEVERQQITVREATAEVEIKQIEIDVLKRFTKEKTLATLKGDWESAKAAANGHEEVVKIDEARMALASDEIERCIIKAERSGLVIYPSTAEWKDTPDVAEGVTVHNDQVLLLMPDLSKMQAKFGIHESMIDHIKPGMTARVTLPDRTLDGEVSSVASAAQPAGWWTGNIVKYDAIVQLPSAEGLKPGMSAEVEVVMARHEDVLMIPIAAVVETERENVCWVGTPQKSQRRALKLGDSNDVFVVVEAGLQEGDQVVLNPTAFIEEAQELSVTESSVTRANALDNSEGH